VLQIHDVLARVYLARLCYILSRARVLDGEFSPLGLLRCAILIFLLLVDILLI